MAVRPDGRIVVAARGFNAKDGQTPSAVIPLELNPDGTLARTFAPRLGEAFDLGVRVASDGKVVLFDAGGSMVARYAADSQIDPSFGKGAGLVHTLGGLGDLQADDKIIVYSTAINPQTQIADELRATRYVYADDPGTGSVSVTLYNDLNHNGRRDAGEPPLANWGVYADHDDDGRADPTEAVTTTDANGSYTMTGLLAGTYRIREMRQDGWTRTQPAGAYPLGYYDLTLGVGQAATGKDFGNYLPSPTPPPGNPPPVANNDTGTTAQDTPVQIDLLANDTDDGSLAAGSVAIISPPGHGTVAVDPSTGRATYTPAAGFSGSDSFGYTVKDNQGAASDLAVVSVAVTPKSGGTPVEGSSLSATLMAAMPPSVVGGAKMKGKASVLVMNEAAEAFAGPVTVALVVSSDSTPGPSDPAAAQVTRMLKLKPGQSRAVKLKFSSMPAVADGTYYVLGKVTGPDGSTTRAAGAATVRIAAPVVDLRAAFPVGTAVTGRVGRRASVKLTVDNLGNVPAKGALSVDLIASSDAAASADDRRVATVPLKVNLRPGAARTYKLKFTIPAELAAGGSYLIATLNAGPVGDGNAANNTAATDGPVLIVT